MNGEQTIVFLVAIGLYVWRLLEDDEFGAPNGRPLHGDRVRGRWRRRESRFSARYQPQPGAVILPAVSSRPDRLEQAFAGLNKGNSGAFSELFAPEAQWLGVPGSGVNGVTPI